MEKRTAVWRDGRKNIKVEGEQDRGRRAG